MKKRVFALLLIALLLLSGCRYRIYEEESVEVRYSEEGN